MLVQVLLFQEAQQPADLGVGKCDLPIVKMRFVLFAVGSRGTVRIVRIVQVHPEKEPLFVVLTQPIQHLVRDDVPGTFHLVEIGFLEAIEIEMVVIEIEAAVQAKTGVQHRRGHDRCGSVALRFQGGS